MITDKQWQQLRDKYFEKCTKKSKLNCKYIEYDIAPHDMFEWFKREIKKME